MDEKTKNEEIKGGWKGCQIMGQKTCFAHFFEKMRNIGSSVKEQRMRITYILCLAARQKRRRFWKLLVVVIINAAEYIKC